MRAHEKSIHQELVGKVPSDGYLQMFPSIHMHQSILTIRLVKNCDVKKP